MNGKAAGRRDAAPPLDADAVRSAYERVRSEVGAGVTVVAATKYVPLEQMGIVAGAGIEVVGENRAQDLVRKHEAHGGAFRWHFIGTLQSNKVKLVNGRCELVHSLDSDSAAQRLEVPSLLQVALAGEGAKSGVPESEIEAYLQRYPLVCGLTTMPPLARDPEESRPIFRRLAQLARDLGLDQLSMGTSQDWRVAVEEGATLVRLGSTLFQRGR